MSVTTNKMSPQNAAAKHSYGVTVTPGSGVTALLVRCWQIPKSFLVERVQAFCTAVSGTVTMLVGLVRPGRAIAAMTFIIGSTTTKFKLSVANICVMPLRATATPAAGNLSLPTVVNVAITDNIAFSSAFTVNAAAAAGVFWGAVRVQMDAAGAFTTKVAAADQVFTSEAYAKYQCPPADPGYFDCGTITIAMNTGTTFTAGATALTGGNISAVNYNGAAAGFVNCCSSDTTFLAANLIMGAMNAAETTRTVSQPGGLLVMQQTTTGGATATDAEINVDIRAWPLDGEVAGF